MAKVTDIYSSPYLTAAELEPIDKRRSAIIHAVAQELVGQKREPKLVLTLVSPSGRQCSKRIVLNKGNALGLRAAYGNDTDDWPGKQIEIWAELVQFQGKIVPGIRLAPMQRQPAEPAARQATIASNGQGNPAIPPPADTGPVSDDDIPF
jgi:hypothetical protein